jgi:MFS transporter, DHA1 family, 2-module integral membrane pump EmrD
MTRAFHASPTQIQWTLTIYLIGFAVSQLIAGPLSEHYGRKKIIIGGFIIFILGNIICALASTVTLLIIFRFLTGCGGGVCAALKRAIIADNFEGSAIAKVWSTMANALVVTLIVAPLVGGYIQHFIGWRANFLIPAIYALLVLVVLIKVLPETNKTANDNKLTLNLIVSQYMLLLKNNVFIGYVLISSLAFASLIAYFQLSPFLYIDVLHLSSVTYGWLAVFIAMSYLIGGAIIKLFIDKAGAQRILILGLFMVLGGGLLMLMLGLLGFINVFVILLPAAMSIVGARLVIPNAAVGYLKVIPKTAGYASALMGTLQMLGAALISFIISKFHVQSQSLLAFMLIIIGLVSFLDYCFLIFQKTDRMKVVDVL